MVQVGLLPLNYRFLGKWNPMGIDNHCISRMHMCNVTRMAGLAIPAQDDYY